MEIKIGELRELVVEKLARKFKKNDCEKIANVMLFGELSGRKSHGLIRLMPNRFGPLDETMQQEPRLEKVSPFSATIKAKGYPGMLLATLGMEQAIHLARENGIALVTTSGNHSSSGCLTYYAEEMAKANLVSFIFASTALLMAPLRGKEKRLGTNPIAIGIPTPKGPIVYDIGTAAMTLGDVAVARSQGKTLPEGVAIDAEGRPTTDPVAAMQGALLPFGGHKGFGLALMIELLGGVLTGASFSGLDREKGWGHLFLALRLDLLGNPVQLLDNIDRCLEHVRTCPTESGDPVRLSGQTTLRNRDRSVQNGSVTVDDELFHALFK